MKKMYTQNDFQDLKHQVGELTAKVDTLTQETNDLKKKIDKAITLLDGNAKALQKIDEELTLKTYRADQVNNLEKRVDKIEDRLNLPHSS